MTPNPRAQYVSVIAFSLLQSVITLIEKLEDEPFVQPNPVQAGQVENGLATGIVVLTAVVVESILNRTRYVREDAVGRREPVTQYWTRIAATLGSTPEQSAEHIELAADLNECFAVRDVVAHSHLWLAEVEWNRTNGMDFIGVPQLQPEYGDRRFTSVIDMNTRRSRRLSLNLFPSRIWRRDAWTVLRVALRLFLALENADRRYCYLTPQPLQYRGRFGVHFEDIVGNLPALAP